MIPRENVLAEPMVTLPIPASPNIPNGGLMATPIMIKHPATGMTKTGYYGFSWTYLFFGPLVLLVRGELGIGALHILFTVLSAFISWIDIDMADVKPLEQKNHAVSLDTTKHTVSTGFPHVPFFSDS